MRTLLLIGSLACLLPAATAQDDPDALPELELSLAEAVDAFFANNLALQGARLDAEASFAGYGSTWGDFDTSFFVSTTRSESIRAPNPANFVGGIDVGASPATESDFWTLSTGVRGQMTTGTSWELALGPTWNRTATAGFDTTVNTGTADFSLTQPLLRGGADDYARRALELAAKDVRLAEADFDATAFDSLVQVITNYWNLVYSLQDVATKELSVELAEDLLGITERKFDQGLQNRIDVIEVEAEVARRSEELLTAQNGSDEAVDALRRLIFASEELEEWQLRIVPTTTYEEIPQDYPSEKEALDKALLMRPAVKRARLALDRADIEVKRAEADALPRLDASAGYGTNSNEETVGLSLRELPDTSFHQARISIDFEMPLTNRQRGFAARQRRLERDRAALSLRQAEVDAIAEVRSAVRDVRLQEARIITTAEEARLRREAYEGEQRRLENDLSTPFQVRESQRDYLLSLDAQTRSKLDLAVARTSLAAAQGILYEVFDYSPSVRTIDLDEAPPLP